jgi:radical SAM protein with 4Fe4S-binding SPASM domain
MTTGRSHSDASYTAAADHTTAARVGKSYLHDFPASTNANKSPDRTEDGTLTSAEYVRMGGAKNDDTTPRELQIDFHHWLERVIPARPVRWLLQALSRRDRHGSTPLQRMLESYRNPTAPASQRFAYWPLHRLMDRLVSEEGWYNFRHRSKQFGATVRGVNIVARSLAEFGLTVPQKFSAPLLIVWNFTNRCNLKCKHCYQDSEHNALDRELSREEKLRVVDQMGRLNVPMLAISGGEPTLSDDLIPVIRRAAGYRMHMSLATNGTTLTPDRCAALAEAGLRYVEVSLDSTDPVRHDAFRGIPGMWKRAVRGALNVVATPGLRLGIAMCVHQGNLREVREMLRFAEDELGAGCLAHFNFIPVGRGLEMVSGDITPAQREELLALLNEKMQAGGMGIISTAPQLGRVCLAGAAVEDGLITCSHAGGGSGLKARVVAKYLGGCGAGRCYVAVEPDGNVTPCVYLPHRVMGNVRDKPLEQIFRQSVFWDILNDRNRRLHHCEVCTFKMYCGGCRARADAYFGQLHAGDPGCLFNDKHWQQLLDDGVAIVEAGFDNPADAKVSPTRHAMG